MASTYLTRTESSGNRKTGTISVWLKKSSLGNQYVYSNWNVSASGYESALVQFSSADRLELVNYQASGGSHTNLVTNRLFRDFSAWYHIVINWDTTQATSSDRYKMYINGVQETSFQSANYPSLNEDLYFNIGGSNNPVSIGSRVSTGDNYFNGSMSHYHWIDGTAYDASAFGQFDANGVWTIKTSPSVTYGTNGFFILKDGNSVTDQSGNGNNFTVAGGTLTNTEDCPSNVFATLNPLDRIQSNATFANGNNQWTTTSGYYWSRSTLGVSSGKYYFEAKLSSAPEHAHVGIVDEAPDSSTDSGFEDDAYNWGYKTSNGNVYNNGSNVSYGDTYTTGDIVAVALDLDNNKLYFSKNGTWQNSGDPTSGATGTGAISITDPSSTNTGNYFFAVGDNASATNGTWQTNFGNGYFGTTAVASAGTNASGIGIFEYDVPTGYTALSTKGLNL